MSIYSDITLIRDIIDCNKRYEGSIISCYNLCLKTALKAEEQSVQDGRAQLVKANIDAYKILCNRKVVLTIIQKVDIKKLINSGNKSYETFIKIYSTYSGKNMSRIKIGDIMYKFLTKQLTAVAGENVEPATEVRFVDVTNALENFKFRVDAPTEDENTTEEAEETQETAVETEAADCWTKELLITYNSLSVKDRELAEAITLPESFREYGQHFTNIEYSNEVSMSKELDNKFIEILGNSAMGRIIDKDSLSIRLAIEDARDIIKNTIGERVPLKLSSETADKLAEHRDLDKLLRKIFAINQEGINAQRKGLKTLLTLSYAPITEYNECIARFNK